MSLSTDVTDDGTVFRNDCVLFEHSRYNEPQVGRVEEIQTNGLALVQRFDGAYPSQDVVRVPANSLELHPQGRLAAAGKNLPAFDYARDLEWDANRSLDEEDND